MTNPHISIPSIVGVFQEFGEVSNFKVNYDKTLPTTTISNIQIHFPFCWQYTAIKYLGVQIPTVQSSTADLNFIPLLHTVRSCLQSWQTLHFVVQPYERSENGYSAETLLHVSGSSSPLLPWCFFRSINQAIRLYIWWNKKPQISHSLLSLPNSRGGVVLPQIALYSQAASLCRIMDWYYTSHPNLGAY